MENEKFCPNLISEKHKCKGMCCYCCWEKFILEQTKSFPRLAFITLVSDKSKEDINFVTSHLQEFTHDNRSGIPGTLHRISAIRNRQGKVVGLTCRIGRVVTGTITCIKDICKLFLSFNFFYSMFHCESEFLI